jgi:HD-GYP domain-containing protein (c-di-GMP phosphodiesterase class II)
MMQYDEHLVKELSCQLIKTGKLPLISFNDSDNESSSQNSSSSAPKSRAIPPKFHKPRARKQFSQSKDSLEADDTNEFDFISSPKKKKTSTAKHIQDKNKAVKSRLNNQRFANITTGTLDDETSARFNEIQSQQLQRMDIDEDDDFNMIM